MTSKPITVETADAEIKKYIELKFPYTDKMREMAELFKAEKELVTFYSSKFNAFLFEKDEILRFFDKELQTGENRQVATHLMVILGAHIEEADTTFVPGSPTVIVTGVVPHRPADQSATNEKDQYRTLSIDDPATEYPNQNAISNLPVGEFKSGSLVFTLK